MMHSSFMFGRKPSMFLGINDALHSEHISIRAPYTWNPNCIVLKNINMHCTALSIVSKYCWIVSIAVQYNCKLFTFVLLFVHIKTAGKSLLQLQNKQYNCRASPSIALWLLVMWRLTTHVLDKMQNKFMPPAGWAALSAVMARVSSHLNYILCSLRGCRLHLQVHWY